MDKGLALEHLRRITADDELIWMVRLGAERWAEIDASHLVDAAEALLSGGVWAHLSTITGENRDGGGFTVHYHFWLGWGLTLSLACVGDPPELPSLCDVTPVANWYEREVHDMFGVLFAGHPALDPLLLSEGQAPTMVAGEGKR